VTLLEGEAHFEVVADPQRPFVVIALGVEVRAVGTAFSVELGASRVQIVVTEGKIAVNRPASEHSLAAAGGALPPAQPLAIVHAGNHVVVEMAANATESPAVLPMSPTELVEKLSWRIPRLEFSRTPLAEVVGIFNRHSRTRIVLVDPGLADLQISGVLRADNTDSILQLLKLEFGIRAERAGENELRLISPPPGPR
jgi:transmembrane sensor